MAWYKPWTWNDESESTLAKRTDLNNQGGMASVFGDQGQEGFHALGAEGAANRADLRDQASGKTSLSAEQLRQGLQQQFAQQRSMAAGAAPGNSAMAARTAAMGMGRAASGMAGQQAMAGIAERQAAQQALAQAIAQARGQDMQVALGSRQNAISAFGGITPEGTALEKLAPYAQAGAGAAAMAASDKRLKKNIKDGDDEAKRILSGLKSYRYDYKDEKHGKGSQYGIMAQELEGAGLNHAVMDTPGGKMVHGAKLATSALGLTAALARRVEKLEGGKK